MGGEIAVLGGVCKVEQNFIYLYKARAHICDVAVGVDFKERFKVVLFLLKSWNILR